MVKLVWYGSSMIMVDVLTRGGCWISSISDFHLCQLDLGEPKWLTSHVTTSRLIRVLQAMNREPSGCVVVGTPKLRSWRDEHFRHRQNIIAESLDAPLAINLQVPFKRDGSLLGLPMFQDGGLTIILGTPVISHWISLAILIQPLINH